jgi:M6 family metalloprotease-like protein
VSRKSDTVSVYTMTKFSSLSLNATLAVVAASSLFATFQGAGVQAMSPNPNPYEIEQPDGSKILAHMVGSEFDVREEDEDGFVIIGAGPSGNSYEYAQLDPEGEELIGTGVKAGDRGNRPAGLKPGLRRGARAAAAMGYGGVGPRRGRGGDKDRMNARSTNRGDRDREQPPRALSNVHDYEHWDEAVEDFHRRELAVTWSGTKKNLVIPMRFSDHAGRVLPSVEDLDVLFNTDGTDATLAPTGSVKKVFQDSSYGLLTLDSDIAPWVQLSQTEAHYADGKYGHTTQMHLAMKEALEFLDENNLVNFEGYDSDGDNLIDSICFLHSGYAAEWGGNSADGANLIDRIWSHKSSLYSIKSPADAPSTGFHSSSGVRVYNYHISPALWGTSGNDIGRIGVIAHETGHFLGITDLYDTGGAEDGKGIACWGLMGDSWGFNGKQYCPPAMTAWSKIQLGWLTPQEITSGGTVTLQPSYYNDEVIKISEGYPENEYLLIEYRKPTPDGFEYCMPGSGGLAVWHIDDAADYNDQGWPGSVDGNGAAWPANGLHYRVALLQADGLYDLEKNSDDGDAGDLWTSGQSLGPGMSGTVYPNTDAYQGGNIVDTGVIIDNIGAAGATISFDITLANGNPTPTATTSPTAPPTISPTASPTVSPTQAPSPPCMDMFGDVNGVSPWVDADGLPYNCAWYASGSSNCDNYGSGYANCGTDGDGDGTLDWTLSNGSCPTANTACCVCGGGVVPPVEGTDVPTSAPMSTPSAKPSASPSSSPFAMPSASPSDTPSVSPSDKPSASPSVSPSAKPSASPSTSPTESPTASPVDPATNTPTKAPVAPPTTDDGCVDGNVSVTLDNYGSETNWKVIETATSTTMGHHAGSSGTTPLTCLNTDMYYHFAISDTWGDGMCCSYGEGSYALQVNGITVKAGGEFSAAEEVMFKPTNQESDVELKFVYKMDTWPMETEWALESDMDGLMGSQAYNTYLKGNRQVAIEATVDPANCYTLRVGDSYGDGVVNGAYWQVYWNGALKYDVGAGRPNGNFGSSMSLSIGNGCAGDAPANASSKVKVLMTTDSPSTYALSHANSKKAPRVQDDSDKDKDESESKSDDNKEDVRGGGRGGERGRGRGIQRNNAK